MSQQDQPHWMPFVYIGVGIIGFIVAAIAFLVGRFGIFDAIIVGLAVGAIVVGVKQLRERRGT
jgi:hypothetical protein